MTNKKQSDISQLNQGVNYMEQSQQPVESVQNVQPEQPVQPVMQQPVVNQPQPVASQPIVNTEALKAQAGNVANAAKNGVNTYVEKLKTNKGILIGSIAGAVVVVILVVMLLSKLLNPSYNVVNKYMSGMKNGNAEKIAKLYHKDIIEARYDGDEDELIDELEEEFDEMKDEDTKITGYKIRECETYSKDELEDLAEYFEEYLDIDEDDVKAAKKYFVRVNLDEDGEKNITYKTVIVVKIGNKWSLYY